MKVAQESMLPKLALITLILDMPYAAVFDFL